MRRLFLVLTVLLVTGCDSANDLPAFSMVVSSPASKTLLERSAPFRLSVEITSDVDVFDMDVALAPRGRGEAGAYVGEGLQVRAGDGYRQFVVDTTLTVPDFDTAFGNDFVLIFMSPSKSTNVVRSLDVHVE